jgi:hypothetical protein
MIRVRSVMALGLSVALGAAPSWGYFTVGQPIPGDAARPADQGGSLRAARTPVRVHGGPSVEGTELLGALRDAERAYELVVDRMGFAAPWFDGGRGGGPELDLYLVDEVSSVSVEADGLDYAEPWDCAPAVIRVRRGLAPRARLRAITEGVAHASLLASDARAARAYRVAFASAIAARALGEGADEAALERTAGRQGDGPFSWARDEDARSDGVFFDLLAARFDDGSLSLWRGLAAMPVAYTPAGAGRMADEPDPYDVLRRLLRNETGGLHDFFLEYATARAVTGTPGDRFDTVGWRGTDRLATPPLRAVNFRELPRWIPSERPLAATGASYVSVDTTGLREGTLSVWFHGAPWRQWVVTAVRLDAFDRDRGRAPSPPVNAGEWSTTMELDPRDARVLLVAVDLGNQLPDLDRPTNRDGSFAFNVVLSNAAREGR